MSTKAVHESEMTRGAVAKGQVLCVATSCGKLLDGTPTGLWLSELAEPYYVFKGQGYDVTIASPAGGAVPLDPASTKEDGGALTPDAKRFLADGALLPAGGRGVLDEASLQLRQSVPLASLEQPASYDCIFLPGGHGPVFDLAQDARLGWVLETAFGAGKCVAAVCHGPAGLLSAHTKAGAEGGGGGDKKPLVAGRRVSAFTIDEEKAMGKDSKVPFQLEARLAEAGATVTKAPPMQPHVEVDGRLVTGQNPASARPVAEAAVKVMAECVKAAGA